mgnify:CR=1 FL=1
MAYLAEYVPHDGVFFDAKAEKGVAKNITLPDGQIVPGARGMWRQVRAMLPPVSAPLRGNLPCSPLPLLAPALAATSKVQVVVDDAALARWPATGNIRFEDVWMQYRLDAPWALKGVTFQIRDGEKVGAVGRTGSGKSTTLLALYRMFELGKGRILVDGVDIATLPLKRLRMGECGVLRRACGSGEEGRVGVVAVRGTHRRRTWALAWRHQPRRPATTGPAFCLVSEPAMHGM